MRRQFPSPWTGSIFIHIFNALKFGLVPTLIDVFKSPGLLLKWTALSSIFMGHVWARFGNGLDEFTRDMKKKIISPYADGVVLDIGAGNLLFGVPTHPLKITRHRTHAPLSRPFESYQICGARAQCRYAQRDSSQSQSFGLSRV